MILNLLGNAIKFTDAGDVVVDVECERVEDAVAWLRFTVSDTGIGITADKQWQIFGPFVQADASTSRRYGGTGLGLTISTQLVELMGGRMWVDSEYGHGSRFHFNIAFALGQPAPTAAAPASDALRGLRVLAVDDNPTSRRVLDTVLASWGMVTVTAGSADEAMTALAAAADAGDPIPIALVDAHMPEADGFALLRRMVDDARTAATKVILLVPAGMPPRPQRRAADKVIVAQLTKPLRHSDLRSALLATVTAPRLVPPLDAAPLRRRRARRRLDVLVVEDNATNQALVAHLLKHRGHRVTAAANGRDAVALAGGRRFDVILMDVQMPGMDGFEAAAAIREQERGNGVSTPIVAVTAHTMAGDRERCLAAGMNAFVAKPLRPDTLLAAIDGLVASGAVPRRPRAGTTARRPGARHGEAIDGPALIAGFGGDRALLDATIAVFLQDAPQQLDVLDAAVTRGHAQGVAEAAHALKGSVGLFSMGRAYAAARRLEMAARRGQTSRFEVQSRAVRRAVTNLSRTLAELGAGPAA